MGIGDNNLKCLGPWGRAAPIPIRIRKTLIMVVFATWHEDMVHDEAHERYGFSMTMRS